jgi:hypothetical protein
VKALPAHSYAATRNLTKEDAKVVGEVIETIARTKRLKAKECAAALVESSRDANSPTHHLFEWDDTAAAEAYRLEQARQIIMSVVVVFEDAPSEPVRAFPVITTGGVGSIQPMTRILEDKDMTAALLEQAKRDAVAWANRYSRLKSRAELRGVFRAIETMTKPASKRRPRRHRRAA